LEYTIEDGSGKTEISRVTSGLVSFIAKPFDVKNTNFGKTSCFPDPKTPYDSKDNPSISGYPDKSLDCCHVDPVYLPPYTPPLPPPPVPVKCSGTSGLHCSHICKPFQQDQPVSTKPPCVQLDVMGITPPTAAQAKTYGKCLIVTISTITGPACDHHRFRHTSFALVAVAPDGYYHGGFPRLPPVPPGKPNNDRFAMETLCTHGTGKDKFFDYDDSTRTSEKCPKDSLFYTLQDVSLLCLLPLFFSTSC